MFHHFRNKSLYSNQKFYRQCGRIYFLTVDPLVTHVIKTIRLYLDAHVAWHSGFITNKLCPGEYRQNNKGKKTADSMCNCIIMLLSITQQLPHSYNNLTTLKEFVSANPATHEAVSGNLTHSQCEQTLSGAH